MSFFMWLLSAFAVGVYVLGYVALFIVLPIVFINSIRK